MSLHSFKRWEVALMAGVLVGLLTAPAKAETLPLSRWPVAEEQAELQYRVTLFPFAVGRGDGETLAVPPQTAQPDYQIKFRLAELWEEIRDAISR